MRLVFALLFLYSPFSFGETPLDLIHVVGICHKKISSDRIRVSYTVQITEKTQKQSSLKANQTYSKLLKEVKNLNLKNFDANTGQYRVSRHYEWEHSKKAFKGVRTQISLDVETSEKDRAGRLLEIGNRLNIQNVSGPNSFVSKSLYQKIYLECLKVASQDAQMKADVLARSLGIKRGKARLVSNQSNPSARPHRVNQLTRLAKAMPVESDSVPQIEYGKTDIDIRLNVSFEVK